MSNIDKVKEIFSKANFINDLGIEINKIEAGYCETILRIKEKHLQQDGFVHAGVLATIADHTAGGAAASMIKDTQTILSIEFKINMLRPAIGEELICKAKVIKNGKTISIVDSEVFSIKAQEEKMVSKAIVTLAVVNVIEKQ
jgi:uncharacterized protein (TIGR00369 family)